MALVTKNFSDIITFSRNSNAMLFDSTGTLVWAPNNHIRNNTMQGAVNSTGIASATVASGGTGYTVGNVLTVSGGTGTAATFTVTGASAGVITSVSVTTAGSYTVFPTSPVSVTGGSGSGATFNIVLNGTLPTNWNVSGLGTLTREVVGTGTLNGVTYIDLRFSGTTSTTQLSIRLESGGTGAIAAANGQTWAMSMWSAIVAGSLTNISSQGFGTLIYDAAGAFIGAPFSSGVFNTTATLTRTQASGTIATAGAAFIQPQIYFLFNSGVAIDITIRIGMPQLELGSTATVVNATSGTAYFGPRLDYNPSTLAAQGLLIEEQRTNSIRNNTMQGAVAGTPGTLPTNWFVYTAATGLTTSVVGSGTENGIAYVDVRVNGTAAGGGNIIWGSDSNTSIAASNGQTWAQSAYVKIQGGTTTGIVDFRIQNDERSASTYLRTNASPALAITTAALNTQRYSFSATLSGGGTVAFVVPYFLINFTVGVAIDITLRIGLPQLENNNISTGVASATVSAGGSGYAVGDVLQIVGGTGSTAARLTVATLSGSAVATVTVSTAGSYSVFPSPQPVSVTAITGTGTSATFNIVPQTQTGFATSVIPTTTTALTRNADVASVNTLSPWFNSVSGTLYAEVQRPSNVPNNGSMAGINDGSTNNRLQTRIDGATNNTNFIALAGSINYGGSFTFISGGVNKAALAYETNNVNSAGNGVVGTTDTSEVIPTGLTKLDLGQVTGAAVLNGWLRRVVFYPRRLSNAELQSITT